MADLQGFPFESVYQGEDTMGNPIYDRAIDSASYRSFWKKYFTNGVFFAPATNFQVTSIGGLDIEVQHGEAHVEGLTVLPGDTIITQLTLENASTTSDRTDVVVLRVDFSAERAVSVVALPNVSAYTELTRNEAVWELGLAKILVRRDATHINQADITDLRLSTDWCGMVTEPITRTDTEVFFQQIMQMIVTYGETWETFFGETNEAAEALIAAVQQQWDTYFADAQARSEEKIEVNQGLWDTFYAGITADIAELIKYASIRIDQVVGLQAALDGVAGQLTAQDVKVQGQLQAQNETMTQNFDAQDARVDAAMNVKQNELLPTVVLLPQTGWAAIPSPTQESDQFTQTVSVAGWLARDHFFCSFEPASRSAFAEAGVAALDTTVDGKITFVCTELPPVGVDISVRLMKVEVNVHG